VIGILSRRLRRDDRGATIVEFAMVLPVMLLLIMGLMEICWQAYLQSVLTGAVQKAGRDSGLETNVGSTSTIDQKVQSMVLAIDNKATFQPSSRLSYSSFSSIAVAEPYTDTNKNGKYDKGECFQDVNGNGVWDADQGTSGQGGANDVVVYTMTMDYPRLFPIYKMVGWANTAELSATTVLRNQPYASQNDSTPNTICS